MFAVLVKISNNPYVTNLFRRYVFDEQPTVQNVLDHLASNVKSQVPWANAKVLLCGAKLMVASDIIPANAVLTVCL